MLPPTAFRTESHVTLFHLHLGGETLRTSPFTWTTCGSPLWWVICKTWGTTTSISSSFFPKHKMPPFMFLQLGARNLKTRVQLWLSPNNDIFSFFHSLNSPYHLYTDEQFVCHEVRGHRPTLGPISLTTPLLAVSRASGKWICLLFGRPGLFSAINLINILIMNLDDSTIRLSGFQTWPLW